jgi:molecular chaperone GrpE
MSGDANHPHDSTAEAVSAAPVDHPSDQASGVGAEGPVLEANSDSGSEGDGASELGAVSGSREEQLEAELAALRSEYESLRSQSMRIAADFDNFRKRQSRDQQDQRLQITCSTLSEILPVVDNFERARQQLDPQHEEAQGLHRSYQGLYKQLVDVFKQLGVSPMRVEGEPFDPSLHEAVLREPSEEHPEDVVIAELQRGYHLDGRVLRHALVKVSMGPGPSAPAPAGPSEGD